MSTDCIHTHIVTTVPNVI